MRSPGATGDDYAAPLVVTSAESRFWVAGQSQAMAASPQAILVEPEGRNTAPAIAVAAFYLQRQAPDAMLLAMPADHQIEDVAAFRQTVEDAVEEAEAGHLMAFGVNPGWAETGYGYVRRGAAKGRSFLVDSFIEKPDLATAEAYIAAGDWYWNAGIYLLRADRYLAALEVARPDIHAACRQAVTEAVSEHDFFWLGDDAFRRCPNESVDYAVMERTANVAVMPIQFEWSDIGSWNAVWRAGEGDEMGNVTEGDVMLEDCKNCYIRSEHGLAVALGVEDLVLVDTPDVVLVGHRMQDQKVRAVVKRLQAAGRKEYRHGPRVYRPWGFYEILHRGELHEVRHLCVNPGARLSLQSHQHRFEHWVVVRGTAQIVRDEEELTLTENQSIYIPLGAKHRLGNLGEMPLSIIEVQTGTYLADDDIVRYEDIYNRL